jgi:hypothetical protein
VLVNVSEVSRQAIGGKLTQGSMPIRNTRGLDGGAATPKDGRHTVAAKKRIAWGSVVSINTAACSLINITLSCHFPSRTSLLTPSTLRKV